MTGFSTESFAFLRELGENNNRDWFNENKAQFTAHLEQPFADLLEALSNRLSDARRPLSGGKSTSNSGGVAVSYCSGYALDVMREHLEKTWT